MASTHARRLRKEQEKKNKKIEEDTLKQIMKQPEPHRSNMLMLLELINEKKEEQKKLVKDNIF
jgi:hypothetical protein